MHRCHHGKNTHEKEQIAQDRQNAMGQHILQRGHIVLRPRHELTDRLPIIESQIETHQMPKHGLSDI